MQTKFAALSIVLVLPLFSCTTVPNRNPGSYGGVSETSDIPKLTFNKMVTTIRDTRAATVAEALKPLRERYPAYLLQYTLMYGSLSVQKSSFAEPRALVFGPDADFVFSFNGGPHQRGGHAFETMEFDARRGEFLFREISFKKEMKDEDVAELSKGDIAYEDELILVSKPNLSRCTQCHGQPARPIWETYFLWPGAYGSEDDLLTSVFNREGMKTNSNFEGMGLTQAQGQSLGRQVKLKPGFPDREAEGMKSFAVSRMKHARFSLLPLRAADQAFVRWAAGENPKDIDTSEATEGQSRANQERLDMSRPNLALMVLLYRRVGDVLRREYKKKYPSLPRKLAYLEKCSPFATEKLSTEDFLRMEDPLERLRPALSAGERVRIAYVSGPWPQFYKKFLSDEFLMETEKISRIEDAFGKGSLENANEVEFSPRPNLAFYKTLIPNLPAHASLVAGQESDGLGIEALRAYISKGLGVDLSRFAINMRRVPTFREGGFDEILQAGPGNDIPEADQSGYENGLPKGFCEKLKAIPPTKM